MLSCCVCSLFLATLNNTLCLMTYRRHQFIVWNDHDDVIIWKHFPRYWPFMRGIHRSPAHKRQWRGALMLSLICARNKRLSKHWWGWWVETPLRSLWRHCNVIDFLDQKYFIYLPHRKVEELYIYIYIPCKYVFTQLQIVNIFIRALGYYTSIIDNKRDICSSLWQ